MIGPRPIYSRDIIRPNETNETFFLLRLFDFIVLGKSSGEHKNVDWFEFVAVDIFNQTTRAHT